MSINLILFLFIYFAGACLTSWLVVKWAAYQFYSLEWGAGDTIFTLFVAAIWPIGLPAAWACMAPPMRWKLPAILPFARWYEAEKKNRKRR